MFGPRSGGISLYAHEGWKRYSTLVGPLSAFGYWIGWSVVLSIFGKIIGDLAAGAVVVELDVDGDDRLQPPRRRPLHRDRGDHLRLGLQHLRPAAGGVVHLRVRGAAHDPARALHRRAVRQR